MCLGVKMARSGGESSGETGRESILRHGSILTVLAFICGVIYGVIVALVTYGNYSSAAVFIEDLTSLPVLVGVAQVVAIVLFFMGGTKIYRKRDNGRTYIFLASIITITVAISGFVGSMVHNAKFPMSDRAELSVWQSTGSVALYTVPAVATLLVLLLSAQRSRQR